MIRAYIRVSTQEQGEGLSLLAQREAIKAHLNGERVRFYSEIASARTLKRKELTRLLAELRPGDKFIILSSDRLSRNVLDLLTLLNLFKGQGIELVCCQGQLGIETAVEKLTTNILGAVNQFWSDITSEKTKASLKILQTNGVSLGQVPYGYYRDESGQLQPDSQEQAVIVKMGAWKKQGLNFNQIARRLSEADIEPKQGKQWLGSVVNNILKKFIGKDDETRKNPN